MQTGIRFAAPVPDELDLILLKKSFQNVDVLIESLDAAPYEISILVCLLRRLEEKIVYLESLLK